MSAAVTIRCDADLGDSLCPCEISRAGVDLTDAFISETFTLAGRSGWLRDRKGLWSCPEHTGRQTINRGNY